MKKAGKRAWGTFVEAAPDVVSVIEGIEMIKIIAQRAMEVEPDIDPDSIRMWVQANAAGTAVRIYWRGEEREKP